MARSASENLRRLYSLFSGDDQVLVVINADPDAIASAMAVKRLLWRRVSAVTLASVNVVERPDNLAMLRLLGVKLLHLDDIAAGGFHRFVMVDSQPSHHPAFGALSFHAVIDHHPDTGVKASFTDIRPRYGATASILTEYLRAAKIKPSSKLATGLFYAIKTDTSNFERETLIEDVRAFQFLFRHANIHLARRIDQTELRLDYLKYFRKALQDKQLRQGKVFAHLGPVPSPDVCVLIADFFMRVSAIDWSIVSGIHDRKLILVFRNDGLRKNAGKLAKERFGDLGSAGGHKSMSRAEIPLDRLEACVPCRDETRLARWILDRVTRGPQHRAAKRKPTP
jgi:nanoRNase/pAp phosphatase (c-di-AMP/oligoRNAs hydrolase)